MKTKKNINILNFTLSNLTRIQN